VTESEVNAAATAVTDAQQKLDSAESALAEARTRLQRAQQAVSASEAAARQANSYYNRLAKQLSNVERAANAAQRQVGADQAAVNRAKSTLDTAAQAGTLAPGWGLSSGTFAGSSSGSGAKKTECFYAQAGEYLFRACGLVSDGNQLQAQVSGDESAYNRAQQAYDTAESTLQSAEGTLSNLDQQVSTDAKDAAEAYGADEAAQSTENQDKKTAADDEDDGDYLIGLVDADQLNLQAAEKRYQVLETEYKQQLEHSKGKKGKKTGKKGGSGRNTKKGSCPTLPSPGISASPCGTNGTGRCAIQVLVCLTVIEVTTEDLEGYVDRLLIRSFINGIAETQEDVKGFLGGVTDITNGLDHTIEPAIPGTQIPGTVASVPQGANPGFDAPINPTDSAILLVTAVVATVIAIKLAISRCQRGD
jgi:hypothetical protein